MANVYPSPAVLSDTVQTYKTVVAMDAAATTSLFTVPASGRFFVTAVVIHDPNATCATTTVALGTTGTSTSSVLAATTLTPLTAATANQYVQIMPGQIYAAAGTNIGVARSVGPSDVLTITVASPAAGGTTVQVDVLGYLE